ncbi:hypothetical protein HY497_00995 [Candidatus Woesearchaeota archaeon]|nr:hypothetical protein [Candidatus Woesearchaeota archaeon]
MTFLDELDSKTPAEMHTTDFKALKDTVNVYGLKGKEELLGHIEAKMDEINRWLLKNNSTGVSAIQEVSKKIAKLEQLKLWKKVCNDFL